MENPLWRPLMGKSRKNKKKMYTAMLEYPIAVFWRSLSDKCGFTPTQILSILLWLLNRAWYSIMSCIHLVRDTPTLSRSDALSNRPTSYDMDTASQFIPTHELLWEKILTMFQIPQWKLHERDMCWRIHVSTMNRERRPRPHSVYFAAPFFDTRRYSSFVCRLIRLYITTCLVSESLMVAHSRVSGGNTIT